MWINITHVAIDMSATYRAAIRGIAPDLDRDKTDLIWGAGDVLAAWQPAE